MNAPVRRIYAVVVGLFAVLVFATAWWSVARPDPLRDNPENKRALLEEQRIHRGDIRAADGTLLARSVKTAGKVWSRRYTQADALVSHAVGYSYTNLGRAGLERSRNAALTGDLGNVSSLLDEFLGRRPVGDDVRTTLDLHAQQVAVDGLAGRQGSVVALDPATGAVKVMASVPGFDANALRDPARYRALNRDSAAPLFNRATQSGYPPGSTFKVVTTAAALDTGKYTPDSVINGNSPKEISGVPLANDGGESFGDISLTTALTHSVNTVFAQIGEALGPRTMVRYMKRFGFYGDPPLDYPTDQMRPSGVRNSSGRLVTSGFDVGRVAIGQGGAEGQILVTPLQMAMVAATVANDGVLMKPHLTDRVVDPDGRTVERVAPQEERRVMSRRTAAELNEMMQHVVQEGTGTAAALQGIDVAGKTGTAEKDPSRNIAQPWFIAFAPAHDPKFAVAVTIESVVGGFGGTDAAPIARDVLEALLADGGGG
jgi:peptidoglycan glycosyltransferase